MRDRPVVGITALPRAVAGKRTEYPGQTVDIYTVQAVTAAGGVAIVLPVIEPEHAAAQTLLLDAVVLSGGSDVDPALYDGAPDDPSLSLDVERDRWELALLGAARARGLPLLGVCRGAQLLNVYLGGSLIAHLDDGLGHDLDMVAGNERHAIACETDTQLAAILGAPTAAVTSSHHQAIDRVGTGLAVSAWSADGIVEAVESTALRAIGVQWHPEFQLDEPAGQPLFDWLVRAASAAPAVFDEHADATRQRAR